LNEDQLKAIIDGQGIDGATIGEWFSGWQRDDLERISRAVQKATVEQLTVSDIAKQIRGTKENDYNDGILATTRVGAVRLARTVINGVCNNARVETIKANSDVIDGIKFVGTLDGKTCPHCASYDGHIWRGEDMASARRPPIHPNCRCTLVPYVELKDEDGNVVDIDAERPAANADFDQLAKDAYNQKAKEKGWKRRFEDLSPSTRLKYYYQAQKDYERETGKPAYRQVDSSLSFPEYFKQQPDSFKRDWLGAKRYEAYKAGKLTEKAIFAPDLGYTISSSSLVKFVEPEVPEELAKLIDEYEKKGSPALESQEDENQKKDRVYKNIVPTFDGISDIDQLQSRWKNIDSKQRKQIEEEIFRQRQDWERRVFAAKPNEEDYSSRVNFIKAYDLWRFDVMNGDFFYESIKEALPGLNIDVDEELKNEVPVSADGFVEKIQRFREKNLGKDEAERANEIAEQMTIHTNQEAVLRAACEKAKSRKEYMEAFDKWETNNNKFEKDKIEREKGRKKYNELLTYVFPDRGGTSFFSEEATNKILDLFDSIGQKSIAEEVLHFYNLVARTYNINKQTFEQVDSIVFHKWRDNTLGDYDNSSRQIRISKTILNNPILLRRALSHELGHWFELRVLGLDRAQKNVDWLIKETGWKKKISKKQRNPIVIPNFNNPNLCFREDGYSQTIYPNDQPVPGTFKAGSWERRHTSEIMSTGIEGMVDDLEIYARKSPRHFNLILENFEEITQ